MKRSSIYLCLFAAFLLLSGCDAETKVVMKVETEPTIEGVWKIEDSGVRPDPATRVDRSSPRAPARNHDHRVLSGGWTQPGCCAASFGSGFPRSLQLEWRHQSLARGQDRRPTGSRHGPFHRQGKPCRDAFNRLWHGHCMVVARKI